MKSHVIVVPLAFQYVFNQPTPDDYFDFVEKYPKDEVIKALSYLINKVESYGEDLIKNQDRNAHIKFLSEFQLSPELQTDVLAAIAKQNGAYTLISSRDTILYALEEVLGSGIQDHDTSFVFSVDFKASIFCYLLCINDIYFKSELRNGFDIEDFNAAMLPANNAIDYNKYRCLLKGIELSKFLAESRELSYSYKNYISTYFGTTIVEFLGLFLRWLETATHINTAQYEIDSKLFEKLSEFSMKKTDIQKLMHIRLSPIYRISQQEYVIMDSHFFMGKVYYQFIYDFWFNYVKPKEILKAETYFGVVGQFFEGYCSKILKRVFSELYYPRPMAMEELKYKTTKGDKEYIDFYARQNKKLLLAEFKLGNINDNDRYGGSVADLYARGRDEFFKNLNQLKTAISNLSTAKAKFDPALPLDKKLTIYPVCVLNDKIFQLASMKLVFSEVWREMINTLGTNHEIKPLVILQVEELEEFQRLHFKNEKKQIWKILDTFCESKGGARAFRLDPLFDFKTRFDDATKENLQELLNAYN